MNLALFQKLVEWGILLVHQTIGRYMLHVECQCLVDVTVPAVDGLFGKAIHQVDADVADAYLA